MLERGFSLAQLADGRLLTRAEDARPGDEIRVRLRRGEIHAEVRATPPESADAAPPPQGRIVIRAAVLGADVSKSRSPAIHRAAFRALGVRGTYEALSVDAAGFDALVAELRARGFRYLNVTIPHKRAADALADARGPEVRASGAANTLLFEAGDGARRARVRIRAENTDGAGPPRGARRPGRHAPRRPRRHGGRGRRRRGRARGPDARGGRA